MSSLGVTARRDRLDVVHRAEELVSGLPPLLVAADRVASTVSQGVHGRRRVEQGETFWQFRRYEPGDATTRIDWRCSARSQRIYIRQTEWEVAQSVWLWRDASASMRYRSSAGLPTKADRSELLLLALASLLIRGGEHVALLGDGQPPAGGRAALQRIAARLDTSAASTAGLPTFEPLPRYARVVVFGDLLSTPEEVTEVVGAFAARGVRGHMVQVLDPAEETLPFSGRVRFEGLEDDGEVLFGRAESVRSAYGAAVAAHRQALESLARTAGWTFLVHRTDRPPEPMMLSLYLALAGESGG